MKQIFTSALDIARWLRNVLIILSILPLCTFSMYIQTLATPRPTHWVWLDSQERNILIISFVSLLLILWFCLEKVFTNQEWSMHRGWSLFSLIWLAVSLQSIMFCWLLKLLGDTSVVVVIIPKFFLYVSTLMSPLIMMTYIQLRGEEKKKAKTEENV